ncbi:MAG: glycosyltransferase family 39 protein [Bacteroidales bacterium]|nr:glycosyltransferase family 39 protein [Bacteroidales bacterium]
MSGIRHFLVTEHKRSIVIAIIFIAVVVRCIFFSGGIRGSDAYAYAQYAYDISSNSYHLGNIADHFGFRYTVLIPTAISYALFGVNDVSSAIFPFLLSILNILIILKIGEKIYDFKTAVVAGIFMAFYPLDILTASVLGPDSFTPILSSLAILTYLIAIDNDLKNKTVVYFCLSGIMVGIAMGARETSIFIYGVLVFFHILKRCKWTPLLWITLGLGIPVIVEMTFYYISEGNAFLRTEILDQLKILIKNDYQESAGSLLYYPKIMFGFELQGLATYGLIWWFTVAGLLFAVVKKDYRNLLPGIWVVLPFLGFEFGVQSFKEMILVSKSYNYLALITPPAMLLSAYFLTNFFNRGYFAKHKPLYITAIFMCLVGMNLYGTYRIYWNVKDDAAPYIAVANYFKTESHKEIYVHHGRWPLFLKYFLRYDPSLQFRDMETISENVPDKIRNAYVIMHQRYLYADVRGRLFEKQPDYARYMNDPPANWEQVISFKGRPTYNDVNLYYAR